MAKWISVKDKLPKHKEDVVFWAKYENTIWIPVVGWMKKYSSQEGDILFIAPVPRHYGRRVAITHWIRLPKEKPNENEVTNG